MTNDPLISTVVLNWNRPDLLKLTLESYVATTELPCELFIVDNGSSDESIRVIEEFCVRNPLTVPILVRENKGGEAINEALERCKGHLVHLSENDIEYLPGWSRIVADLFDAFPELGQLSPFGPVPEDNEVWVAKRCALRHANGRILYEAHENLGTTCVLRRELIERGLRVHNVESQGSFLFPDDIRLSAEVKQAGFFTAFAPHYLVHNRGHWAEEFTRREDYYRENYCSKPVGEEGWRARIQLWRARPHPKRSSLLFPDMRVSPEKSIETLECREPWLWSMFDEWTAEVENVEFLYALVRLLKPRFALETRCRFGITATAIGGALRDNGRGRLVTIEPDRECFRVAAERISAIDLQAFVHPVRGSSLDYIAPEKIELALFDSELPIRGEEFRHFLPMLAPEAMVLFHDSSSAQRTVRDTVDALTSEGLLEAMLLPTPRGLAICRLRDGRSRSPSKNYFGKIDQLIRGFGQRLWSR